jgi:hypothetical protein
MIHLFPGDSQIISRPGAIRSQNNPGREAGRISYLMFFWLPARHTARRPAGALHSEPSLGVPAARSSSTAPVLYQY